MTANSASNPDDILKQEQEVLQEVRDVKGFYLHVILATLGTIAFFIINWMVSPWYYWAIWAGLGLFSSAVIHGILVFDQLGKGWERRQVEKRLKR